MAPPEPIAALTQALRVSHAQRLGVDIGIDRHAIRHELFELISERARLQTIARECPKDRTREIDALTKQREQVSERLKIAQSELAQLDQQRGWRRRGDRKAREIVLTNQLDDLAGRVARFDEELQRARRAHRQAENYTTEHRDELERLPHVQAAIEARTAQLVDADVANPPRYLRLLDQPPNDPARLADWRRAADFVERFRIDHGINDPQRPLGAEPKGGAATLWRYDAQHLDTLATQLRHATQDVRLEVEL